MELILFRELGVLRIPKKAVKAMKITSIFLLVGCLQVSAYTTAQVKIDAKNTPIEKVLDQVAAQAGVYFLYNPKDLAGVKVTVSLKNVSVESALSSILQGSGLSYAIDGNNIVIQREKKARRVVVDGNGDLPDSLINVQGKVTNEKNEAVVGASIAVKGGTTITASGTDGTFTLSRIKRGAILMVSSVGYEPKVVKVSGDGKMSIQLTVTAQNMKEVTIVNTGYQKLPRERSTGSYAFVDSTLFNRTVSTNVLDRLDGTVSSLLFDRRKPRETFIQIRGLYTLTTAIAAPLIVLDNFPYAGDLSNINPNDVENVTVLRDAASTSIWGAKAGNGVIVITTKRGKLNQPFRLNVVSNTTIVQSQRIFELPQMSTSDFIDVEAMLFAGGFYNRSLMYPQVFSVNPVIEILNRVRKNEITQSQADEQVNKLREIDVRREFKKLFYRTGVNQQYSLNLSGGNSNMAYYASVGVDKNLLTNRGDELRRINLTTNVVFSPIKRLQVSINTLLTKSDSKNNGFADFNSLRLGGSRKMYPYAQFEGENNNPLEISNKYGSIYTDTAGAGRLLDWKYRPLQEHQNYDRDLSLIDITTNFSIRYEFARELSAEVSARYQYTNSQNEDFNNLESFYTRDLINTFSQINGNDITYIVPLGGVLDTRTSKLLNQALRGQINYSKMFGKNRITALAGVELRETEIKKRGQRLFGYNKETNNSSSIDNVNSYPLYFGGRSNLPSSNLGFQQTTDKLVSAFANAAYTYDERYTLNLSARQDASNLFGVTARNKWKPLWSAGAAWHISQESFYHSEAIPYLNLRFTYGYSGNVNNAIAAITTTTIQQSFLQETNIPFATLSNIPNPDLGWETVQTTNLGFDFSLKDRVLTGSIEYYLKKSRDVIANKRFDPTSGIQFLQVNSAHMKGDGLDIQLNSRIPIKSGLFWSATLNLSYAYYKVTRFLVPPSENAYVSNGTDITPLQDQNPFALFSYKWGGLDPETGSPLVLYMGKKYANLDSILPYITFADQMLNGPALPKFFGNFLNTIYWKGISLSANITYRLGYYFRKPTINYSSLFQTNDGHSDFSLRWKKPGDEIHTSVPSMIYPDPTGGLRDSYYSYSSVNVGRGDHFRLEDIRLSYNLDRRTWKNLPFSNVQFSLIASNLNVLIWKANKWGIDPDYLGFELKPGKSFTVGLAISL